MLSPLPYTPATVARIRAAAPCTQANELAQSIGWELSRLERIARQHTIELIGAKNGAATEPIAEPIPVAPESTTPLRYLRASRVLTSAMTLAEIAGALGGRQAQVFDVLHRHGVNGQPLSAGVLCASCGISRSALAAYVSHIRLRLRPTRWSVEGLKGREGGYRLISVGEGS